MLLLLLNACSVLIFCPIFGKFFCPANNVLSSEMQQRSSCTKASCCQTKFGSDDVLALAWLVASLVGGAFVVKNAGKKAYMDYGIYCYILRLTAALTLQ